MLYYPNLFVTMNITTTQDINNVNVFYSRDLLLRAQPLLVHTQWAMVKDIPTGNSMTIKFRRYSNLPVANIPLSEGVTPNGHKLQKTDLVAICEQYGDYVTMSDKLTMTTEDPVRMEANDELSDQFANTIDQLCRDEMVTTTSAMFAGTGNTQISDIAAGDILTQTLIESTEESLKLNLAKYVTGFVDPSDGISTTPLPPAFWSIIHTNITKGVRAFAGFIPVEKYSQTTARIEGEIGKVSNTRFVETVNAKIYTGAGTAGIDVYATLVIARQSYGISRISGHAVENIAKDLGAGEDPLNQRSTVGWKATFVAEVLNEDWIFVIYHSKV